MARKHLNVIDAHDSAPASWSACAAAPLSSGRGGGIHVEGKYARASPESAGASGFPANAAYFTPATRKAAVNAPHSRRWRDQAAASYYALASGVRWLQHRFWDARKSRSRRGTEADRGFRLLTSAATGPRHPHAVTRPDVLALAPDSVFLSGGFHEGGWMIIRYWFPRVPMVLATGRPAGRRSSRRNSTARATSFFNSASCCSRFATWPI